ncbi:uncharacterized protein IUM83_14841 [Phytophthora cinnamomi]|uniref:uncharacterized protein n=1 Tax=Phytophthora cinnamomi TaxID=4785 RepID=UPI003559AD29|nr:hypothetical protein IUM83_14841 [Phytophthora cinnamomi]
MAFAALSRRHVATPVHRCKRKGMRHTTDTPSPITTPAKKVSLSSSTSPSKCARSESLRSTWMTSGSDSAEEEEEQEECTELQVFVQLQRPLSDWVYWQRDAEALPDCWTRVFAVFCGDLLWLYRYEDAAARSLLLRLRVTALDVASADTRQLQFHDAAAASVRLCMPDAPAFHRWHSHVCTALARAPPTPEEQERARQRAVVPAVASAMHKKSFWKALAAALVAGAKSSSYCQVASQEAVVARRDRKSLGQRWKRVTMALKLGKKQPQLAL